MTELDRADTSARQIEIEEFLQTQVVRRRLLPRAFLVGLIAGVVAIAFRISLKLLEDGRNLIVAFYHGSLPLTFISVALIGAIGTYISMKVGQVDPDSGGSGIPQMKAVLEGHLNILWWRILWVKFLGALVSLGAGLALGREGPTVQMGGAVGEGVSRLTGSNDRERRALTAAGSGAGLASAFNAPLAGVTFVLEELQRDFQPIVFVAALLCAAVATVISRMASGQFPVFEVPHIEAPSLLTLPLFAVIGLLGGLLGVIFNKGLLSSLKVFDRFRGKSAVSMAIFVGVALGAAA